MKLVRTRRRTGATSPGLHAARAAPRRLKPPPNDTVPIPCHEKRPHPLAARRALQAGYLLLAGFGMYLATTSAIRVSVSAFPLRSLDSGNRGFYTRPNLVKEVRA